MSAWAELLCPAFAATSSGVSPAGIFVIDVRARLDGGGDGLAIVRFDRLRRSVPGRRPTRPSTQDERVENDGELDHAFSRLRLTFGKQAGLDDHARHG